MSDTDRLWTVDSRPALQRRSWATITLRPSERKLLLGAVDLFCANITLAAVLAWRFGQSLRQVLALRPSWYIILTSVWLVVALLLGSYDLRRAAQLRPAAVTGAVTSLVTAVVYLLIPYVTPPLPTSRLFLVIFLAAMVGAVTAWRVFYALVMVRPALRRKALVIGAGRSGQTIVEAVSDYASAEYDLLGFVDDESGKQGRMIAGLPVLGTSDELGTLIERTGASEIIVAITQLDRMHPEMFQAIMSCHERGVQVRQMPVLFEQLTGRVPAEHAGRNLHIVLPLNGYPSHFHLGIKTLFDTMISLLGIVITGVLLPFVWLAHRFEGRGPIFHKQVRQGRGGQLFMLIKFRTMVADAEANGPQWAEENDRRITRVGRVLRRLHLDEIPQAINILRGELSFIGPRPERPEFVAQLEEQIPFYRARHAVKPGITGWAQVNYRYGASVEDALIKLQYDLFYIKYQSVWLDLAILVKTIALVLALRGR